LGEPEENQASLYLSSSAKAIFYSASTVP
jgi:hypothetical protein